MSGIGTGEVAAGIVASLAIIALFVGAIVLSKRGYSLTTTFKLAPRALPRQAQAAATQIPGSAEGSAPSAEPVPSIGRQAASR